MVMPNEVREGQVWDWVTGNMPGSILFEECIIEAVSSTSCDYRDCFGALGTQSISDFMKGNDWIFVGLAFKDVSGSNKIVRFGDSWGSSNGGVGTIIYNNKMSYGVDVVDWDPIAQGVYDLGKFLSGMIEISKCKTFTPKKLSGFNTPVNPNVPINDHICLHCKNDRCSKSEKICWRCGALL